jgi:hypothetical protein
MTTLMTMILLIFKQLKRLHLVQLHFCLLLLWLVLQVTMLYMVLATTVVHSSNHSLQLAGIGVHCLIAVIIAAVTLTAQALVAVAMQQRVIINVILAYAHHSQVSLLNFCLFMSNLRREVSVS